MYCTLWVFSPGMIHDQDLEKIIFSSFRLQNKLEGSERITRQERGDLALVLVFLRRFYEGE